MSELLNQDATDEEIRRLGLDNDCYRCAESRLADDRNKRAQQKLVSSDGRPMRYVVVWETGRADGGPEEGGWSYKVGEAVEVVAVGPDEDISAVAERMVEKYPKVARSFVWDRRCHEVTVEEDTEGRLPVLSYPLIRPHYC